MALTSALPKGSRQRTIAAFVVVTLLVLLYTQLVLPGSAGSGGRGTPAAILFQGLVLGLVNSLTAAGIVLIYRTQRIINFAQTALGIVGSSAVFSALYLTDIPFLLLLPFGLLFSGLAGAVFDLLLRRFQNSARLVLMVFTIAAAQAVASVGPQLVQRLPFIPRDQASLAQNLGTEPIRTLLPFSGFDFQVGSLNIPFGFPEILALDLCIIALALVAAFFRFTKAGVAIRAMAENTERASLLGISVGTVTLISWTIAGLLSGTTTILTGAIQTPGTAAGIAPTVLLPALAAATVARFRSFPIVIVVSILIQLVARSTEWSFRDDLPLVNVALFLIIGIGLVLQRGRGGRSEEGGGVSWQATDEPRPIPKELSGIASLRIARSAILVIGVLLVVGFPYFVSTKDVVIGSGIALAAILTLSIVVLTGWAGQVSLGQFGFYAVGAVVGGSLSGRVGVPFWIAVPLATAITGGFALLVGIPALRLKGLFLAVTTFAFGIAAASLLFNERYVGWLLPEEVERPKLLLFDFEDERTMYYLCVLAFIIAAVVIANLRRSRFGRVLIATRENEANVQAFGVPLVRMKLMAFAVSGALCGFAGSIFAHLQRGLDMNAFGAANSVELFVFAVLGGVSSIGGAVIGSALYQVAQNFFQTSPLFQAVGPFLAMFTLFALPGGLIAAVNRGRDGVLRIIAQRRQIVVPSLFADYDPELLARRLIPLGEASSVDGLAAIPVGSHFAMESELYAGRGERVMEKLAGPKQSKEAAALGAASRSVEDVDELIEPAPEPAAITARTGA